MEVAEKKGLPKLKYHLLPRTKGFCVTVQHLRGTGEKLTPNCLNKPIQKTLMIIWSLWTSFADFICVSSVVSAVYDSTLNFRNNQTPTLLGVLNGKKYHADLYVR